MVFKYILFRKLLFIGLCILCVKMKHSHVRKAYCAITKEITFRVSQIFT